MTRANCSAFHLQSVPSWWLCKVTPPSPIVLVRCGGWEAVWCCRGPVLLSVSPPYCPSEPGARSLNPYCFIWGTPPQRHTHVHMVDSSTETHTRSYGRPFLPPGNRTDTDSFLWSTHPPSRKPQRHRLVHMLCTLQQHHTNTHTPLSGVPFLPPPGNYTDRKVYTIFPWKKTLTLYFIIYYFII